MKIPFVTETEILPGQFTCYAYTIRPRQYPIHTHGSNEFFLCISGSGQQVTNTSSYEMLKDDFFFFGRGIPHACKPSPDGCKAYVLNVSSEAFTSTLQGDRDAGLILDRLSHVTGPDKNKLSLTPAGLKKITALFDDMIYEFWKKNSGFECAVKIRIQELLLTVLRDKAMTGLLNNVFPTVRSEGRLHDVLSFLRSHYMEHITVDDIAGMAHMSRSHFHSVFRKVTGKTLVQYINELRTEAAARMLQTTDYPITHIAFDCGFPCVSHFYAIFTSVTGVSPGEFRKKADRMAGAENGSAHSAA